MAQEYYSNLGKANLPFLMSNRNYSSIKISEAEVGKIQQIFKIYNKITVNIGVTQAKSSSTAELFPSGPKCWRGGPHCYS